MENGPPINPILIKKESTATVQGGKSKEEKSFNKKNNKVANKDKP